MIMMKKNLALLLTMMVSVLALTACGGPMAATVMKAESAEQAVTNALNAVKAYDLEKIDQYFIGEEKDYFREASLGEGEQAEEALGNFENGIEIIVSRLEFTIQNVSEDGDAATVTVDITATDMEAFMAECFNAVMPLAFSGLSDEEMDQQIYDTIGEILNKEDNPTVTSTVDIHMDKTEGGWKLVMSPELLNALTGNLADLSDRIGGVVKESMGDADE